MTFESTEVGYQVTGVFTGINFDLLEDTSLLSKTAVAMLEKEGFTVLDSVEHKFDPQGFTFLAMLSESHFAIHTFPEHGSVYFHLYSCGTKGCDELFAEFKKILSPKDAKLTREDVSVR